LFEWDFELAHEVFHQKYMPSQAAIAMEIRKAVIFGATGATGRQIARELLRRNIKTRVVSRSRSNLEGAFGGMNVGIVVADLQDPAAARGVADSCDVIFQCVGLPTERFRDHILVSKNTISAMQATGAKGVLIGSFWSYGPTQGNPINETQPRRRRLQVSVDPS
jgi:nucleoside-diphosphate-sugar epimerase